MLRRIVVCALVGCLSAAVVQAAPAAAGVTPSAEARDLRAWLMRIHDAAAQRNFQGTFVISAGGAVSSARLSHFVEGDQQYERIESLDGEPRVVLRHGEVVHTVWPQRKLLMIEQRDLGGAFPALLKAGDDHIADHYEMVMQGAERQAGQDAQVFNLRPRDAWRFGWRLWAERSTGLLLRSDVLNERGEVLESSAFSDVTLNVRAQPEAVLAPMKKAEGFKVMRGALTPVDLGDEGWVLRRAVPGFLQVRSVKRPLDASEAPAAAKANLVAEVLQTVLSDGLTYVSIFIEPYNAQRHTRPMLTSLGATHTLMRRQGDWWITVVGDVPAGTLRLLSNALERKKR
jgi:sigma-E factor negative regulatory protein RseB